MSSGDGRPRDLGTRSNGPIPLFVQRVYTEIVQGLK